MYPIAKKDLFLPYLLMTVMYGSLDIKMGKIENLIFLSRSGHIFWFGSDTDNKSFGFHLEVEKKIYKICNAVKDYQSSN